MRVWDAFRRVIDVGRVVVEMVGHVRTRSASLYGAVSVAPFS